MSTITLTDTHGDALTVTTGEDDNDGLNLVIEEDDQEAEVYWPASQGAQGAQATATKLRDFLSDFLSDRQPETPNEAKLSVAAEHSLRAKFAYKGDDDAFPRERRVEVEALWDSANGYTLVSGESYDEDGEPEGYRQFRLDRLVGPVVVR